MTKWIATLGLGAALAFGGPQLSQAQQQSGLVNVNVGDVTILRNVNVGVAAQVAANVCGVAVGPVAALTANVLQTQSTRTVCSTPTGPVTISPVTQR